MSFYLLEIGSEEIPAGFIGRACDFLKNEFQKQLKSSNVSYSGVTVDGTPRRLYVYVDGLAERQKDSEETIMGPPASIAFDADGGLTKAGLGFAKSKGLETADLKKVSSDKGEYLAGVKKYIGVPTRDLFRELVPSIIKAIPFQKSMRWGDNDFRFARPVHWFLSIFDGELLPFEIDGIEADKYTYGHRIMCPEQFEIKDYDSYRETMARAKVIVDTAERKRAVLEQIEAISSQGELNVITDEELLDTVVNLVETPVAVLGYFNEDFLKLPPEVLITSMKNHQKYFYVEDNNGKLMNCFVGVSNTGAEDMSLIRTGYERVLRARLSDAMFFYENDIKVPLEQRTEELRKVVYQEKLGTSYQKMERFREITGYLTDTLDKDVKENADRAAYLCKADLLSEMVYEFPELQGIMGREYAGLQKEPEAVCRAIYEHYLPRFAGDDLPADNEGAFVSLADKLDTICGCFCIGLIPSGNNDPYALRRNAIGIIQIIRSGGYRLRLSSLLDMSLGLLEKDQSFDKIEVKGQVREFIVLRLRQLLLNEGIPAEAFDAVQENFDDIILIEKAAKALGEIKGTEEFAVISQGYKRINNILKKTGEVEPKFSRDLFEQDEEKALADTFEEKEKSIRAKIEQEDFDEALRELLGFSKPVNAFFDGVMVMAEDESVKKNRLGMLAGLRDVFGLAGDLSRLA
ncbi:glycine--tRNA ligase subunit beta [Limisalsivibrio acetivorans]|uniref:glycine--tRNA ligase subunit beta n=1 Tax=Limisalsivibrio acetivorans TaxID=1304888 RepID=UPI0003B4E985|nr:glycine--tRNA ligase subunit beta [Limisalsivibrio acetivorans]